MDTGTAAAATAADLLLRSLRHRGVDYFFANPGTDFPSIAEGFARADERGANDVPKPVLVPHENAAVAMAHGVYMVTGRPQAVMVHVNVGTGNTLNALIDASRDNVPLLLMAGRSPITERGMAGARTRYIHWAQEMFDQAGMVREMVKWDYELRVPDQTEDVVTRALEVAMTAPRGPVYLTLPREVLAGAAEIPADGPPRRAVAAAPHPDPAAIETLAEWIAAAERPLVVTGSAGRDAESVEALTRLAERFALPVIPFNPRYMCFPYDHPMHQGFQPKELLEAADLVLVLESDVPWYLSLEGPPAGCKVAHLGVDPSFARYPIRSFPVDLAVAAATAPALGLLSAALERRLGADDGRIAARRAMLTDRSAKQRARWLAESRRGADADFIGVEFLSRCIGEAVDADAIVVNEYPLRQEHCPRTRPGTYFGLSPAGGLGWGMGAALGAKLAAPERLVVATLGDGAYVFANPTACHWTAEAHGLPILTIVFNNSLYGAVRNATLAMYRGGAAAKRGGRVLADLGPSPAYEKLVEASGGYGARVERPDELPAALARAVEVVRKEKRQALLNVICRY